jgi:hypothetical protein
MINKIFLALTAITYGWLGGWALFNPSDYVSAVGLSINSDLGSAELRAVYGGINFLIAFFKTKHEKSFFKILLFIISGILLGRFVTVLFGEFTSAFLWGFTAFEIVYLIFLYTALKRMEKNIF